ncbi:hypothetical protein MTR_1g052310 [Medicago truncatula]|uniref:Uncharacterized protein n=1 Tax=Medicago truncatula TaxID=3880 RepID=A0A072VTW4_MEDTR|nr:hypothetical protein MTR_1g052310 [Medicago truncatula]
MSAQKPCGLPPFVLSMLGRPWAYIMQFAGYMNFNFQMLTSRLTQKELADYFNKGCGDVTEFGSIMDSSIQLCSTYLTNSHVEFIRRQTNEVAHALTKGATSSTSFHAFDDIPTYITDLIFNNDISYFF